MCTLYQKMYALASFREWSVPDSGSPHTIIIRLGYAACNKKKLMRLCRAILKTVYFIYVESSDRAPLIMISFK